MAITVTTRGSESGGVGGLDAATLEKHGGVVLALPTEASVPKSKFSEYVMLIYGERKIGKTSLAARFPRALFLMFEVGGKALSIHQMDMGKDWAKFKATIALLKTEQGDRFDTVVIDTADFAYEACFTFMCRKLAITHPTDENDFGKSWGLIEKEFTSVMLDLQSIGKGVIYLSHAKQNEIKTRSFGVFNQIVPTLATQAAKFIVGGADILAYYGYFGDERYLIIRGNDNFQAGCRLERNFIVAEHEANVLNMLDASVLVDSSEGSDFTMELEQMAADMPKYPYVQAVPMGTNAIQSYTNLMRAFRNEQAEAREDVTGMGTLTDAMAALKVTQGKR